MPNQQRVERLFREALTELGLSHYEITQVFPVQNSLDWCCELADREGRNRDRQICVAWNDGTADNSFKAEIKRQVSRRM